MTGPTAARSSPRPGVTAIVLAGGRSSRFGGPKLAAELDGATLLDHALRAAASVADDIVVAGPSLPAKPDLAAGSIRLVVDAEHFAGPLAALAGALRETSTDLAIVVAGDMPGLVPAVLGSMVERLGADRDIDAAHLASPTPSPHRQVLPLALRVGPASKAAAEALAAGDRSIIRLLDRLRTLEIPASEWLPLDPTGWTLLDVDEPADLERLREREIR